MRMILAALALALALAACTPSSHTERQFSLPCDCNDNI